MAVLLEEVGEAWQGHIITVKVEGLTNQTQVISTQHQLFCKYSIVTNSYGDRHDS